MACGICSAKGSSISHEGPQVGGICVRCLTFWIIVGLLLLGILAHKHHSDGEVYFG